LSFRQIERELYGFLAIMLGNAISEFANSAASLAHSNDFIASRNELPCPVKWPEWWSEYP